MQACRHAGMQLGMLETVHRPPPHAHAHARTCGTNAWSPFRKPAGMRVSSFTRPLLRSAMRTRKLRLRRELGSLPLLPLLPSCCCLSGCDVGTMEDEKDEDEDEDDRELDDDAEAVSDGRGQLSRAELLPREAVGSAGTAHGAGTAGVVVAGPQQERRFGKKPGEVGWQQLSYSPGRARAQLLGLSGRWSSGRRLQTRLAHKAMPGLSHTQTYTLHSGRTTSAKPIARCIRGRCHCHCCAAHLR